MSGQRQFLGESPDERRSRRRAQLVEAALDLAADTGISATSVRSVCSRAGLTSRYFYENFANLDELYTAVLSDTADAIFTTAATVADTYTGDDPRERVRLGLGAAVGVLLDDPRRAALVAALAAGDPAMQRQRRMMAIRIADSIRDDPVAAPSSDDRVSTAALFIAGGVIETVVGFADGGLDLTRDRLLDQLTDFIVGTAAAAAAG